MDLVTNSTDWEYRDNYLLTETGALYVTGLINAESKRDGIPDSGRIPLIGIVCSRLSSCIQLRSGSFPQSFPTSDLVEITWALEAIVVGVPVSKATAAGLGDMTGLMLWDFKLFRSTGCSLGSKHWGFGANRWSVKNRYGVVFKVGSPKYPHIREVEGSFEFDCILVCAKAFEVGSVNCPGPCPGNNGHCVFVE